MLQASLSIRQSSYIESLKNLKLDTRLLDKLEWLEMKNQAETLITFLPDVLLNSKFCEKNINDHFDSYFMLANFSGLADFCQTYNKNCNRGIESLKGTLNAYMNSLIDIIHYYNGDLVSINMFEFVAIWKEDEKKRGSKDICTCALSLQNIIGNFKTETDIFIQLSIYLGFENINFTTIGIDTRYYFVTSTCIEEARTKLEQAPNNIIIVGQSFMPVLHQDTYKVARKASFIVLEGVIFDAEHIMTYGKKFANLRKICSRHFIGFNVSDDNEANLNRNIPDVTKFSPLKNYYINLRNFVFPRVYECTDSNFSMERLTFFHPTTMQIICVHRDRPGSKFIDGFKILYETLDKITYNHYGMIDRVYFFSNFVAVVAYYSFKIAKPFISIQNALKSSMFIRNHFNQVKTFKFSIVLGEGLIFTAVLGHVMRRDYFTISYMFKKLFAVALKYPNMVVCDYNVFSKAKVTSQHFVNLSTQDLDIDYIFEVKEEVTESFENEPVILGRQQELEIINEVIAKAAEIDYYGICYYGSVDIGKTTLLKAAYAKSRIDGNVTASLSLPEGPQRPYFCIDLIYKQLYNIHASIGSENTKNIETLPTNLWNLQKLLQNPELNKKQIFTLKVKMYANLRELISLNPEGFLVVFLDDVQYLDLQSIEMIQMLLEEGLIRLICTGNFMHENTFDVRYKLSLCSKFKMLELEPIEDKYAIDLTKMFLNVSCDVPKDLTEFLKKFCGNSPGLMHVAIKELVQKGVIEIHANVVHFVTTKLPKDELTFQSIYCDAVLCFSTNEQSVIMTSVALGKVFKRSILKEMLENPPDAFLALAIIHLFEANIFDCATKYLMGYTLDDGHMRECKCTHDEKSVQETSFQLGYTLPRYAHCELIYFKDNHIRTVVNDLIDQAEKKQLMQQLLQTLEEQDMQCTLCKSNNLISTFSPETFTRFLQNFNDPKIVYSSKNDLSDLGKQPDYTKNIIRTELKKIECDKPHSCKENDNKMSSEKKLKCIDTSLCFCLDFIIRTNSYLTEISFHVGHQAKKVFFLLQYSVLLINLGEHLQALNSLKETLQYLREQTFNSSKFAISENLKTLLNVKTKRLLGEVQFDLENYDEAKRHVNNILQELKSKSTMPPTQSFIEKLVSKTFLRKMTNAQAQKQLFAVIFRQELALSYNLASRIFCKENCCQLALLCCMQSYQLIGKSGSNLNYNLKIHINTLEMCCTEASQQINKKLIQDSFVIFTKIDEILYYDSLIYLVKLTTCVFELTLLNGRIADAITLGYNILSALEKLGGYELFVQITSTLASSLLIVQRIKDAVCLMKVVYNMGKAISNDYLIIYYSFCLEMIVETGFALEKSDKILEFYNNGYLSNPTSKIELSTLEIRFLLLLYQFYLRTSRYKEAMQIKSDIGDVTVEKATFVAVTNIMRYTECLLVTFARKLSDSNTYLSEKTLCGQYLENFKQVANHWVLLMPRYLHYSAYLNQLLGKKKGVAKILNEGSGYSVKQGNALELAWILCSDNAWHVFLTRNEHQEIDWVQARTYSAKQWSQIMFPLPSYT